MAEYYLKVQARALGDKPFRWEIYREGKPGDLAVRQSRVFFQSDRAARKAGEEALARLQEQGEAGEDFNQRAKRIVDKITGDDD